MNKNLEEMNKVLKEVQDLITTNEAHVKRLADSCITFEQLVNLPEYVDQLCKNVKQISTHYTPCFWWRKMYDKEVNFKLNLSADKMHQLLKQKYKEFIKD